MESIQKYMDDTLEKVDAETALRVLAQNKPIWTVDTPGVSGDFRLVSYNLTPGKELFRRVGIPGEESKTDDIAFIEQANLLDLMKVQWFLEAQDYHDEMRKTGKTMTAGELFDSVTTEPGEGTDFIRIPNGHGVSVKVYRGSTIHIPEFDFGRRGNQFVHVQDIHDADTISAFVSGTGETYKIEKLNLTRKKFNNKWMWDADPEKEGEFTLGIDYVRLGGAKLYKGMEVKITDETILLFVDKREYQIADQWLEILDFVNEEEVFVNISLKSKLTGDFRREGIPIHVSHLGEFRDKAEKEGE